MKVRNLFFAVLASAAVLVGCQEKEQDLGAPSIEVTLKTTEPVASQGGEVKASVLTTRDWKVAELPEGVESVTPQEGKASANAQEVTIKLGKNEGRQRTIKVKFNAGAVDDEITITQNGEVEVSYASIASVREKGVDATLDENTIICGVVISNKELNNFTSSKVLVLQDETAGIYLFLTANHEFNRGSKVEVDLSGAKIGAFGSMLQISDLANEKVTLVEENVAVEAKKVSMTDFLAHKYESQYVEVESDVQVIDADFQKNFVDGSNNTNIGMEDESGNKFYVRSGKYSSFKDEKVPQGSGRIKGIASRYNNDVQLYFSVASDYAALTGERFGSKPVESVSGDIATVLAAAKDTPVSTEGVVMGIYEAGCVISDNSGTALIVNENVSLKKDFSAPNVKIGDKIKVSGTMGVYGELPQIIVPADYNTISVTSSGNAVTYPEPISITKDNIASIDRTKCNYITFDGTLTISGNYYNVAIDGTAVQGSLSYVLSSLNVDNFAGKRAVYTGYFCGGNNSSYVNMLVVNVEDSVTPYLNVEPTSLSFTAAGEEKSFTVESNVAWTATSSDPTNFAVVVDGTTVKVTATENTDTENGRTATVTVIAAGNEALTKTVTLTQSKKFIGGEPIVLYTLDASTVKGKDNSYAGSEDILVEGVTWNATGNTTMNPWRIGGKSLTSIDREVYTKTPYSKGLTKVVLTLGTASGITLNSCKLIYSTNSDFSGASEILFDYKNGDIELVADFPANCYYKFVFNVTVSGTSNKYFQFSKVVFWGIE